MFFSKNVAGVCLSVCLPPPPPHILMLCVWLPCTCLVCPRVVCACFGRRLRQFLPDGLEPDVLDNRQHHPYRSPRSRKGDGSPPRCVGVLCMCAVCVLCVCYHMCVGAVLCCAVLRYVCAYVCACACVGLLSSRLFWAPGYTFR